MIVYPHDSFSASSLNFRDGYDASLRDFEVALRKDDFGLLDWTPLLIGERVATRVTESQSFGQRANNHKYTYIQVHCVSFRIIFS